MATVSNVDSSNPSTLSRLSNTDASSALRQMQVVMAQIQAGGSASKAELTVLSNSIDAAARSLTTSMSALKTQMAQGTSPEMTSAYGRLSQSMDQLRGGVTKLNASLYSGGVDSRIKLGDSGAQVVAGAGTGSLQAMSGASGGKRTTSAIDTPPQEGTNAMANIVATAGIDPNKMATDKLLQTVVSLVRELVVQMKEGNIDAKTGEVTEKGKSVFPQASTAAASGSTSTRAQNGGAGSSSGSQAAAAGASGGSQVQAGGSGGGTSAPASSSGRSSSGSGLSGAADDLYGSGYAKTLNSLNEFVKAMKSIFDKSKEQAKGKGGGSQTQSAGGSGGGAAGGSSQAQAGSAGGLGGGAGTDGQALADGTASGTPSAGASSGGNVQAEGTAAAGGTQQAAPGKPTVITDYTAPSNVHVQEASATFLDPTGDPTGGDPSYAYDNINGLIQAVLMESYRGATEDMRAVAQIMRDTNNKKNAIRAELKTARASATAAGGGSDTNTSAKDNVQNLTDKLQSVGDDQQMMQLNLQAITQQQQQVLQMLSNFLKSTNDNSMAIIRHIGGG